jgi:nucleotide-binding universal stress UspA family protein
VTPVTLFGPAVQPGNMYDELLVPTDGSEGSEAAVEQGVAIADRFDATVHFLNVVDIGTEMSASGVGTIAEELTETFEAVADRALGDAKARAEDAGVPHERTVVEGLPHEAIAEYAVRHDVDLVVMGASGRSGIAEHLLGSTTDRVARSVDTSVLIARA